MISITRCPACGRRFEASAGYPHHPFCSERCQLVDLGAWLNESRRIPGEPATDQPMQEDADSPHTTTH